MSLPLAESIRVRSGIWWFLVWEAFFRAGEISAQQKSVRLIRTPTDFLWLWTKTHPWKAIAVFVVFGLLVLWILLRRRRQGRLRSLTIKNVRTWFDANRLILNVVVLLGLLLILFLAKQIFVSVYSGESGVLWSRFFGGTRIDQVYVEGLHIIYPWDILYVYDIRLREYQRTYLVLSSDGLDMKVSVTVKVRPLQKHLGVLHREVGPDYLETLVFPELGAQARRQMALYQPVELYSLVRERIQREILAGLREGCKVRYTSQSPPQHAIFVEDVLIRNIELPELVQNAIEMKLTQRHKMLEYQYRLGRELLEKERKRIEAEGIRTFQDIVNEGISERYLQWKGIDATLELARSNNSKIVVIGGGKNGLPIILGNVDGAAASSGGSADASGPATAVPGSATFTTPVAGLPATTPVGTSPPANPGRPQ